MCFSRWISEENSEHVNDLHPCILGIQDILKSHCRKNIEKISEKGRGREKKGRQRKRAIKTRKKCEGRDEKRGARGRRGAAVISTQFFFGGNFWDTLNIRLDICSYMHEHRCSLFIQKPEQLVHSILKQETFYHTKWTIMTNLRIQNTTISPPFAISLPWIILYLYIIQVIWDIFDASDTHVHTCLPIVRDLHCIAFDITIGHCTTVQPVA